MASSGPVLIIEDHEDSRAMMAALLARHHVDVVTAADGVEGLALAREHHPCLILLDLGLPVMDGVVFRQHQLADGDIKDIPVVVVSARDDAARVANTLGARACLRKPIDFQHVIEHLRAICGP